MKKVTQKVVNKVKITNNYDQFNRIKGNRPVSRIHVNKLKRSMRENFIPMPIVVNDKNEIIDGQHRFVAAKELGLDVPYITIDNIGKDEVHRLNLASKNWVAPDFMNDYCENGNPNYVIYKEFLDKYGFDHNVTNAMLSGKNRMSGGSDCEAFRQGKFVVKDLERAIRNAERLTEIGKYYPCRSAKERGYKRRYFIYAMLDVFDHPRYNHGEFIKKLRRQSSRLDGISTIEGYLRAIEKIYNNNRPTSEKLRFYL